MENIAQLVSKYELISSKSEDGGKVKLITNDPSVTLWLSESQVIQLGISPPGILNYYNDGSMLFSADKNGDL